MFGWFKPVCPIDLTSKVWVEERLIWVCEKFGTKRILDAPRVLPTREFFPDPYHGTEDDLAPLFRRVCGFMGANPDRFRLSLFSERRHPGIMGLYERGTKDSPKVSLLRSLLPDQEVVIATLAHEVAHDLLLGAGLLTGDEEDHEQLTDLLPVALGMGTFQANTRIKQESWIEGNMSYWSISKAGYLTAAVCGYAMGVVEWLRHSPKPSSTYLGLDAAGAMQAGYRYLTKTNDCLIDRNRPDRPISLATESLAAEINGSASRCLYLLNGWQHDCQLSPHQIDALRTCLQRNEPEIQCIAISLLATVPKLPVEIIDELLHHLRSTHREVCRTAIWMVGQLKVPSDHVTAQGDPLLDELLWLTRSPATAIRVDAATALGNFGPAALPAVPRILPVLIQSLARTSAESETLFKSLGQIVGSVKVYLKENPGVLSDGHRELVEEGLQLYASAGIR